MTFDRATCEDGAPRRLAPWALALAAAGSLLAVLAAGEAASPLPPFAEQAQATITRHDLEVSVTRLAGDAWAGRATGHPGNEAAARYLADALSASGLSPLDDRGFVRPLAVVTPRLGAVNEIELSTPGGPRPAGRLVAAGDRFQPHAESPSGEATGTAVFAGFGIGAPSLGYDDYAGIEAAGRIVVAFEGTPTDGQGLDPLGSAPGELGSAAAKAATAKAHGALALLLVPPAGDRRLLALDKAWPAAPSVRQRRVQRAGHELPLPTARVSGDLALTLLTAPGGAPVSLDALHAMLVARANGDGEAPTGPAAPWPVPATTATVRLSVERTPLPAANVVGHVEGGDPVLRDGFVLVGAHFDHDGLDAEQRIFNGADDNASGVSGVLEVAQAFGQLARAGHRPRRSVVFALWNGEEHGLLGSRDFAESLPPAGGRRPIAVLNLDMIGRNEHIPPGDRRFVGLPPVPAWRNRNALHLVGYSRSPDLLALARQENAHTRLELRTTLDTGPQRLLRRSDHWPFLQARVPGLFFFTGLHPDYHTPDDDVEKLNFEKMTRVVQLVYRMAWRLADAPTPPAFVDPEAQSEP